MASTKYDFNKPILGIDDEEINPTGSEVLMLYKQLSGTILNSNVQDNTLVMKFFDWAFELRKTKSITLDDTDCEKLKTWILSSPHFSNLEKGRYIEALKATKK